MSIGRLSWVGPLVGVVAAMGCAQIWGLEKEYRLVEDDGAVGTLGGRCAKAGALACAGHAQKSKLICGPDGTWATNGTCDGETLCDTATGLEQGTCKPAVAVCAGKQGAQVVCDGTKRVRCGPDLVTTEAVEACANACVDGRCGCKPASKQCGGNTPQTCDASGAWQDGTACSAQAGICVAGACVMPPSCAGLPATCGPSGHELCCATTAVPGGSYDRKEDNKTYPATVSSYLLDRFEVTVGRFRKFVAVYPGSKPKAGDGAHPLIAGSGWDAAWDANLPADQPALVAAAKCNSTYQTWKDTADTNENLPMNCISWYVAMAFCAWDGGRLPTEVEWNYAAAGGSEQRDYPCGIAAPDSAHATYGCTGDGAMDCAFTDILKVGSKSPQGDGKWGQADLAGSMWEWNLDWYASPYSVGCDNCANLKDASGRVTRGGGWDDGASSLLSSVRSGVGPTGRYGNVGARCARTP